MSSLSRRMITAIALFLLPALSAAQSFDTSAFAALRWREIGPYRGGRSVAVAGSSKRPYEYWMGTTGGGVFKTIDGGMNWQPATDKYFGGTIGAIAVAESNPDIVCVGGGETDIRGNTSHGDGVWKTTDAGKTWTLHGLRANAAHRRASASIRPIPTSSTSARSAMPSATNTERGVFKTTDGGKTWQQDAVRNDSTGVDRPR